MLLWIYQIQTQSANLEIEGFSSFNFVIFLNYICDAITQNESELANINLKIQPNKADNFVVFHCFCNHAKCYFSRTNCPIPMGFFIKLKLKWYCNRKCQKTNFAWSYHIYQNIPSLCISKQVSFTKEINHNIISHFMIDLTVMFWNILRKTKNRDISNSILKFKWK